MDPNTRVGYQPLYNLNVSANGDSAAGFKALWSLTTGIFDSAFGHLAGYNSRIDNRCTFIGAFSGRHASVPLNSGVENSTAIGYGAEFDEANMVVIGNEDVLKTVVRGDVYTKGFMMWNVTQNKYQAVKLVGDEGAEYFTTDGR